MTTEFKLMDKVKIADYNSTPIIGSYLFTDEYNFVFVAIDSNSFYGPNYSFPEILQYIKHHRLTVEIPKKIKEELMDKEVAWEHIDNCSKL